MKTSSNNFEKNIYSGRYREILTKKTEIADNSKKEIINWIMRIYKDAENMGLDLAVAKHYIQVGIKALNSNDWEKALTYINQSVNSLINLKEMSSPELNIKKIPNIQFQTNKWNKLDLEINNIGNIHASEVKIFIDGDFKVKLFPSKESTSDRVIKVNEVKILPVEIYPKKKGKIPIKIKINYNKFGESTTYTFNERIWIQAGDVLGNTKLKRRFGYHNGYLKMELDIINEDPMDINEVVLELIYNNKLLALSHVHPIYSKEGKKFHIGHISPSNKKKITVYFDPTKCTETFIGGGVTFRDWRDKEKYIMLSPQKVRILCPVLFTKDNIGLMELDRLINSNLKHQGRKIINLPIGLDIENSLKLCKELIFTYNVKLVQDILQHRPNIVESWFYGTTEDAKFKFVIKVRIDDESNCIEFFIASSNSAAITGLLTDFLFNLNKELLSRGLIQEQIRQIDNIALVENIISNRRCLLFEQLNDLKNKPDIEYAQEVKDKTKALSEHYTNIAKKEMFFIGQRKNGSSRLNHVGH
jgi:hypothetical protein